MHLRGRALPERAPQQEVLLGGDVVGKEAFVEPRFLRLQLPHGSQSFAVNGLQVGHISVELPRQDGDLSCSRLPYAHGKSPSKIAPALPISLRLFGRTWAESAHIRARWRTIVTSLVYPGICPQRRMPQLPQTEIRPARRDS
jgi:hypothetical protein